MEKRLSSERFPGHTHHRRLGLPGQPHPAKPDEMTMTLGGAGGLQAREAAAA
jgi:hypothetical protein